jgi:hypothetical protein
MSSFLSRVGSILLNEVAPARHQLLNQPNLVSRSGGYAGSDYELPPHVASAMASVYTSSISTRDEYNKEFKRVESYYLVDSLIVNVSEDALTPDIVSGEILRLTSDNPTYQAELDRLQEIHDLDNIVNDIIYDLLSYGEYPLRMESAAGKGVIAIHDDVDFNTVIGFYKQGYPYKFMCKTPEGDTGRYKIEIRSPHDFAHFILSGRKIRIKTWDSFNQIDKEKLPENFKSLPSHVRVGRPLLYGVLAKIKELQLLENLIPASKLSELAAGSIIGVEVPPSTDPKEAFNIARQYENLFNKKVAVDINSGMMSAVDILTQAGKTKVIPTFNGKGGMQNIDVRNSAIVNDMTSTIKDVRDVICTSMGFPTELLYGGASKAETIKKYARYLRKIKAIQNCIANGVLQIAMTHLKNIDETKDVKLSDIQVEFRNEIVNIDELEKLEYNDTVISYSKNVLALVTELDQMGLKDTISQDDLKTWIKDQLSFINYDVNASHPEMAIDKAKLKDRPKGGSKFAQV